MKRGMREYLDKGRQGAAYNRDHRRHGTSKHGRRRHLSLGATKVPVRVGAGTGRRSSRTARVLTTARSQVGAVRTDGSSSIIKGTLRTIAETLGSNGIPEGRVTVVGNARTQCLVVVALRWVGLLRRRSGGGAAVACVEGRVVEGITGSVGDAVLEQVIILSETVADALVDVGSLTLEGIERVELASGNRVLHPSEKLLVADDPDVLHVGRSGGPVQELVEHFDLIDGVLETGIAGGEVDGVSVDTERLTLPIVVVGESVLHPREHVRGVGSIEPRVHEMSTGSSTLVKDGIHWDLPEAGKLGLTTTDVVDRIAVVGHAIIKRVRPESVGVGISDRYRGGRGRVVGEASGSQMLEVGTAVVEERCTVADDGFVRDTSQSVKSDEVAVNLGVGGRLFLVSHGVVGDIIAIDVKLGDLSIVGVVERDKVGHERTASVGVLALSKELVDRLDGVILNSIIGSEDDELRNVLGVEATRRLGVSAVAFRKSASVGVAAVSSSRSATTVGDGLAFTASSACLPLYKASRALRDGAAAIVEEVAMSSSQASAGKGEESRHEGRLHR